MSHRGALLQLHLAVLLFGVSGLFGKWLVLAPTVIVAGRTLFGALALLLWLAARRADLRLRWYPAGVLLLLSGVILALHWVTFFHAIQLATVAIGMIGFATFPLFVTLLEPLLFGERLRGVDVASGAAVLVGLYWVAPGFSLADGATLGLLWAVFSAFTFALLALLNRRLVRSTGPLAVTFYQQAVAFFCLLPLLGGEVWPLGGHDLLLLAVLGVVCTALPHALFIASLGRLKAQLASVVAGLEPVYGIILAALLLAEVPSWSTVTGGMIVLGAVFIAMRAHGESSARAARAARAADGG